MITVTRRFEFCYSHHLPEYEGKCKNVHGHNAMLEVEYTKPEFPRVKEEWEGYPGMLIDFSSIKKVVNNVLDQIDHTEINSLLDPDPPTSENLLRCIVDCLRHRSYGDGLVRVRLSETRDCWCEWRSDQWKI